MNRLIVIFAFFMLFAASCEEEEQEIRDDVDYVEEVFNGNNEEIKFDNDDIVVDSVQSKDEEDSWYEEKELGAKGSFKALFNGASIVEGIVALHFIKSGSSEEIFFTEFDIDPVEEGLFTYKEVEGAIFPELVTNPATIEAVYTIYWEVEEREVDLVGLTNIEVLKKLEKQ